MIDRREALGALTLAAGAALAPLPLHARPRTDTRLPPALSPGDMVGIIAPAGASGRAERLERVRHTIAGMGLVPRMGQFVGEQFGYLAGTDAQRASDINTFYADPEVKALFAMRGGWGCARLLPLLDWESIRRHPKLLVGYSDITALHLAFAARAGFPTLHAPNAANSWPRTSWESLWYLAFAGATPLLGPAGVALAGRMPTAPDGPVTAGITTITPGRATGRLLGGNLTVLTALGGSPYLPDFAGAILFLEDVGEEEYRIDRMLTQLALAGALGRVVGVVFGQCSRCTAPTPPTPGTGFALGDILRQHLAPLGVPVFTGANIGHVRDQLSLPSGALVEMDADAGTIRPLAPIVRRIGSD